MHRSKQHFYPILSSLATRKKKAAPVGAALPTKPRVLVVVLFRSQDPSAPTHGRFPPFLLFFCYVEVTVLG
jgi:hypothetical protein